MLCENLLAYFLVSCRYSMILLAVVDHKYHFRYINVGSPGRCHDAHVYGRSKFSQHVESDGFQSPLALIEGTQVPPIILCDQAFPLTPKLMKPFANATSGTREGVFNYILVEDKASGGERFWTAEGALQICNEENGVQAPKCEASNQGRMHFAQCVRGLG